MSESGRSRPLTIEPPTSIAGKRGSSANSRRRRSIALSWCSSNARLASYWPDARWPATAPPMITERPMLPPNATTNPFSTAVTRWLKRLVASGGS